MDDNELVLCVPRHQWPLAGKSGFFPGETFPAMEPGVFEPSYRPRGQVEEDESLKQICTYAVLFREDGRLLNYFRVEPGAEVRLAGKASIGVGGHVNFGDLQPHDEVSATVMAAAKREIAEETGIRAFRDFRLAGIVNDETTPVGRCHIGAVYFATVGPDKPDCSGDLHCWNWNFPERLRVAAMEPWSAHLLTWLLEQKGAKSA